MAKKRTATESPPDQPATTSHSEPVGANPPAPVSDTNGTAPTEAPPSEPAAQPSQNGGKRKPNQTFKVFSDKTTVLEVAVWENDISYDDRRSVQHSIVLSRSFKNAEGKWVPSTTFRTHDLPLVRVLLDLAHAWCVQRRTEDSSCPF